MPNLSCLLWDGRSCLVIMLVCVRGPAPVLGITVIAPNLLLKHHYSFPHNYRHIWWSTRVSILCDISLPGHFAALYWMERRCSSIMCNCAGTFCCDIITFFRKVLHFTPSEPPCVSARFRSAVVLPFQKSQLGLLLVWFCRHISKHYFKYKCDISCRDSDGSAVFDNTLQMFYFNIFGSSCFLCKLLEH